MEKYLAHAASTVRQITSNIFGHLLSLSLKTSGTNMLLSNLLVQSLAADWPPPTQDVPDTDSQTLDSDVQVAVFSSLPPKLLRPETSARGSAATMTASSSPFPDLSPTCLTTLPTHSWEWKEGRFFAYELLLDRMLSNHEEFLSTLNFLKPKSHISPLLRLNKRRMDENPRSSLSMLLSFKNPFLGSRDDSHIHTPKSSHTGGPSLSSRRRSSLPDLMQLKKLQISTSLSTSELSPSSCRLMPSPTGTPNSLSGDSGLSFSPKPDHRGAANFVRSIPTVPETSHSTHGYCPMHEQHKQQLRSRLTEDQPVGWEDTNKHNINNGNPLQHLPEPSRLPKLQVRIASENSILPSQNSSRNTTPFSKNQSILLQMKSKSSLPRYNVVTRHCV